MPDLTPEHREPHAALREALARRLAEVDLSPRRSAVLDELLLHAADAAAAQNVDVSHPEAVEAWLSRDGEELAWVELARELARAAPRGTTERAARLIRREGGASGLLGDVVHAARSLRAAPGFTAVAVTLLALGIGLVSSVFSLVDHVLLKPLPVTDEQSLLRLFSYGEDGFLDHAPMSYPELADLEAESDTLAGVANFALALVALESPDGSELVLANIVTGDFFELLGVKASLGRTLLPEDDARASPQPVVVLGHEVWIQRFGADPGVVGREVQINGQALVVVGVAAKGFRGLARGVEPAFYLPLGTGLRIGAEPTANSGRGFDPSADLRDQRFRRSLWGVARLQPGASLREAGAEIEAIGRSLATAYPEDDAERRIVALPIRQVKLLPGVDAGLRTMSWALFGVVGLVLAIACANLANLVLARGLRRRQEVATRLALGAGRWRLARLLLVENLLVAILGGGCGLALAATSNALLGAVRLPLVLPFELHLTLDWRVVLFTFALATLTALAFGLAPVLEAWRTDLATTLRRDSARAGSRGRRRLQAALVVAQVGLSLLLLVAGGLSLRSVLEAQRIDPGFETEGAIAATLMLELQGYDAGRSADFYRRLREELSAIPGVSQVSLPSHLPLTLWLDTWSLVPKEQEHTPRQQWPDVDVARVDPSYFAAMAIPLEAGRSFEPGETTGDRPVVVINQTLAERFWPGQDPLGRLISASAAEPPYLVVGVARDGKYRSLGEEPRPFVYFPISDGWSSRTLVVRFEREELASTTAVAEAVRSIDRHVAISNLAPLPDVISFTLVLPRAGAIVFGALGGAGLLLAAVGLYGLLAYAVGQRRQEIGLRVALGANRGDVLRMVVHDGLRLTLLGAALGLGAALASTRLLGSLLYGVSPTDGATLAVVVCALLVVACFASVLPAVRATRIDPNLALRHD